MYNQIVSTIYRWIATLRVFFIPNRKVLEYEMIEFTKNHIENAKKDENKLFY